jgi:hypothetical protein
MVERSERPYMSLPPSDGVMLERLVMLGAVALIAFGIATVFF